jgi:predicted site-specific integrase-resolvase
MEPQRIKISTAAKLLSVTPLTIRRGIYAGRIPFIKTDTGRVFIPMSWINQQTGSKPPNTDLKCAIYARESFSENKSSLESQTDGLKKYATAKGYQIVSITQEIASGINDDRKKLHQLLQQKNFDVLLVEHKDKLTRFGFKWFETLCPFKIEVINLAENETHDLMFDLVSIITSFCARLYGQRRGRTKTDEAIKAIKNPND